MNLTTTGNSAHVAITKLKEIHSATHPAALPLLPPGPLDTSDKMEGVTREDLLSEALKLRLKKRADLAGELLKSLEELTEAEHKELWLDVAERRLQEMRDGKVREIPAEEVFARGRERRAS